MKWILSLLLLAGLCVEAKPVRFYIGTVTDKSTSHGIYTGTLDPDTGKLGPLELVATLRDPHFLALSSNGKYLYSLMATNGGSVAAFRVDKRNGHLTLLNDLPAGKGGGHVSVDATGRNVFVADYSSGSLASFTTKPDGSLDKRTALISFTGSGPNPVRQKHPFLHSTGTDSSSRHLYACDLGTDNIWCYDLDARTGALTPATPPSAKVPPGSGPRHQAFSPDGRHLYVNGEMGLNVTVFAHDPETGVLTSMQTVPVLPPDVDTNGMTSSEIFCHPSGKWLYVSNRDTANPNRGRDSIAVFAIGADGKLAWLQNMPAGVKVPRAFSIDPAGRWLIVGGELDNQIVVLKIDPATGELSVTGQAAAVGKPVCVIFAK